MSSKAKSAYTKAVDDIQNALRPFLKDRGFKVRGRTFNRITEDGLTQVINIQMGPSDPPGTTYIPGLSENLHGLFTVNLGIYVPEVARHHISEAKSWVQEYHCCVRARLGNACGEDRDIWWHARFDDVVVNNIRRRLELGGLTFLDRFSTRDKILTECRDRPENMGTGSNPPRIVMAIILAERGQKDLARELLNQQVLETRNTRHPDYVRKLANKLGLGSLDG